MSSIANKRQKRTFSVNERLGHPGPKNITLLAMEGVQLLDVAGPLDVFAEANVQAGYDAYRLRVVAASAGTVRSSSGVRIVPDGLFGESIEPIHTLLVAGTPHAATAVSSPAMLAWLKRTALGAKRFGSVCSGAFLLAATGLLDGRRVTTHWAVAKLLAQRFPKVRVEEDALYVRDGRLRTAAGVTAGLDLALALVEEDLGREVAKKVAAQLVMFFKRPGGQLQFSRRGEALPTGRSALQEVQRYIAANPGANLSIEALAKRIGLGPRHFARIFRHEVGSTPATWVLSARVTAVRHSLESGSDSPKQVAMRYGFHDTNTMRRAFLRIVGVTPAEYRRRYTSRDG